MGTGGKGKSRTVVLAWGLVAAGVVVALLLMVGSRLKRGSAAVPPEVFSVFYTCDTQGHIEPCGCASGMAGGISRRQTFLAGNVPRDFLLVDAGDVGAGAREWEVLELEYILKGYTLMGYHAVNLGHRDLSLGREGLQRMQQHCGQLVSANVLDLNGATVVQPYVVVELSNGYRCGILGVVDDHVEPDSIGPGLRLIPPADAITRYLPRLRKQADFIVLLAFVDELQMQALAQRFFEINLIVGGKVRQGTTEPILENRSAIVFNTDKGKNVGRLDIGCDKAGSWWYAGTMTVLEETMDRDAQVAALVEEYKEQLKLRDFRPVKDDEEGLSSISAARSRTADWYVGPESCSECHETQFEIWRQSRHAHAFDTLEQKGQQYNPRCLKCHTVGYMASDGYVNERLTDHLKNVSCEACHGRGEHHSRLMAGQEVSAERALMKLPDCLTCHDKENSPNFDRDPYWERIVHANK